MKLRVAWQLKVLTLAGLIAAIAALLIAPAADIMGADSDHGHGPAQGKGLLITENRDRLAVWVQPIGGAVSSQEAQALVQGALSELAEHRHWGPAGLAVAPPTITVGCPATPGPYLLQPGVAFDGGTPKGSARSQIVATPSQYRVHVYLLPQDQATSIFGNSPLRSTVQEMLCKETTCGEVTTGLYLSSQELQNRQFLKAVLERAIGLERSRGPQQSQPNSRDRGVQR